MTFQYFLNRLLMGLLVPFIVEYHFKVVVYRVSDVRVQDAPVKDFEDFSIR